MTTTRQISKKLELLKNRYLVERAELFNQYSEAYVEKFNNEKERYAYYANGFYRIISMEPYLQHNYAFKSPKVLVIYENGKISLLDIQDEISRYRKN